MKIGLLLLFNWLKQLYQVAANVFGLSAVVVNCSSATTLEDFSSGVLIPKQPTDEDSLTKVGVMISVLNICLSCTARPYTVQTQSVSSLLATSSLHFHWKLLQILISL